LIVGAVSKLTFAIIGYIFVVLQGINHFTPPQLERGKDCKYRLKTAQDTG